MIWTMFGHSGSYQDMFVDVYTPNMMRVLSLRVCLVELPLSAHLNRIPLCQFTEVA